MDNVKEMMDRMSELCIYSEGMDDKLCVLAPEGPIESGTMFDIASAYCEADEKTKNVINDMFYKFTGRYFDSVFCEWAKEEIEACENEED